ncbi:MAG: hypothetical protein GY937_26190 [bacterium]|nr:hypothetical protein [bacterium]
MSLRPALLREGSGRVGPRATVRASMLIALSALIALAAGCSLLPMGDGDAEPAGARTIRLEEDLEDRLHCRGEGRGDCADWFAAEVETRGVLRVAIETETSEGSGVKPPIKAALLQDETRLRARGPGGRLRLQRAVEAGTYLIHVWSEEPDLVVPYRIEVRLLPFRLRRFALLEVDTRGGVVALEIAGGSQHGLRVGMTGNVVEGKQVIGRFRVTDVYPEGSRVEVQGRLRRKVTPSTEAEVELPPTG